jgi:hypothetical protein
MLSRLENRCQMGHTALFPGKNDVRAEALCDRTPIHKDIVTISHGALDVLNIRRHQGRVLICDQDFGVTTASHYIRVGDPSNGKSGDYPRLTLLPEFHGDIREGVHWYLERWGCHSLGAIDLDLTSTVDQVWEIARDILNIIRGYTHARSVTTYLTYRDGRDSHGREAATRRVECLMKRLGKARCVWHRCYRSDHIGRFATRERGSSMAIVGLKVA